MLSGPQRTSQRRCDYVKQKNQQNVAANKFISNSIQFDERKIGRRCVRVIKMLHRLWIGMRRNVDGQTDFRDACIWYDINGLHSQWRQKGSGGKRKNQVKCPECQFTILELRDEFVCMWIRGSCRNVAGRNKAFVQCENFVFTILLIVSMHSKCDSFNSSRSHWRPIAQVRRERKSRLWSWRFRLSVLAEHFWHIRWLRWR